MTANTPRKSMSAKRRHAIFTDHLRAHQIAPCVICGEDIHRNDDRWIIEHVRALALCGRDVNTNCGPAHYECASTKTHEDDLPRIRKAKRQQAAQDRNKSAAFLVPDGVRYDWKLRRYVREPNP